jgi:CubicO group peptidase (beta-lactamase class C family)
MHMPKIKIIDEFFKEQVELKQFSGSVLIAQKGKILLNAGYGLADYENEIPITPQTKFYIGSITKQITAAAVMILYERREIELDQPVCIYLPECPDHWQAITIHHLLTHTSGLDWEFLEEKNLPGITYEQAEVVNWYWDTPLAFEPGDHFSYSSGGYALLGYLIEQISGQIYRDFVQSEILNPLEMTDSGFIVNDNEIAIGYLGGYSSFSSEAPLFNQSLMGHSAGGMYATTRDLYRWDRSFYTFELLSPESVDLIFTPYVPTDTGGPYEQTSYGYGWFVGENHDRRIAGHSGGSPGYSSMIRHYSDDETTMIILANMGIGKIPISTWDYPASEILRE